MARVRMSAAVANAFGTAAMAAIFQVSSSGVMNVQLKIFENHIDIIWGNVLDNTIKSPSDAACTSRVASTSSV
jgi:hypothetical protein